MVHQELDTPRADCPERNQIFDQDSTFLGDKENLSTLLSDITTIHEGVLADPAQ
jgi:hypothetical protein